MTDGSNALQHSNAPESVEALRETFAGLANCASESCDRELGLAAAVMTDLLTVAAMFSDDTATSERADEILRFCYQEALPTLETSESDDLLKCLRQDVEDRWRDSLSLLAPDERVAYRQDLNRDEAVDTGWSDSPQTVATDDKLDDGEDSLSVPADLHRLLSSLSQAVDQPTDAVPEAPGEPETIDDPEMVAAFADDAQQCLSEMEASVLTLETGQAADEPLQNFCRQLHTLKGASGTVGLTQLSKYLHDLESYVESCTGSDIDIDRLLECVDAVRAQLTAPGNCAAQSNVDVRQITPTRSPADTSSTPKLTRPMESPTSATALAGTDNELFVRVEASRLERLMDLLAELVMLRNRRDTYVDSLRTIHGELNHCTSRTRALTSLIESSARQGTDDAAGAGFGRQTARTRLLSRSLDEVSKDTTELSRSLQEVFDPLAADNSAVSHLIGHFRQELMELRRLPISGLFQRLQRAIRDAAKAEGKQVEIHFEGQGARAERTVQERLFEPLLHLVRNAVSHGIQSRDERVRIGKPAEGRITLTAHSDASFLSIEVRDDGNGFDDEALESRGRELGLLPLGETVSRKQLWKLIFHPGFSTKSSISEISGRGVGMDVVNSWVRRLRGSIDVESVAGQGTTFRLQIPLRSAVEHAMVVRSDGQLFALPMHAVSGTSDSSLPVSGLLSDASNDRVVALEQLLGRGMTKKTGCCHVRLRNTASGQKTAQRSARGDVTIAVDAIVGVEEVVVRSLPSLLQRNELFAGVTLSGRAETVLLLDSRKLIEMSQKSERGGREDLVANVGNVGVEDADFNCILIVDDSVAVRRSLSKKLSAAGHRVREASNGRDALDLLKSGGIAAVVTDIDMPVMNGIELLQEMKRQREMQAIPVTVLTSRDHETLPATMSHLHPTAILNKPVTDESITAIIDSLTGVLSSRITN